MLALLGVWIAAAGEPVVVFEIASAPENAALAARLHAGVLTHLAHADLAPIASDRLRSAPRAQRDEECPRVRPCLDEIHRRTGGRVGLSGTLVRMGDVWALSLRRLQLPAGTVEAASTRQLPVGDERDALMALGPMLGELFAAEAAAPSGPTAWEQALWRSPPPPLPPALAISGAIAALGTGLASLILRVDAGRTASAFDRLAASPTPDPAIAERLFYRARDLGLAADVTLGVAGGLAALSLLAMLFSDWGPDAPAAESSCSGPGCPVAGLAR